MNNENDNLPERLWWRKNPPGRASRADNFTADDVEFLLGLGITDVKLPLWNLWRHNKEEFRRALRAYQLTPKGKRINASVEQAWPRLANLVLIGRDTTAGDPVEYVAADLRENMANLSKHTPYIEAQGQEFFIKLAEQLKRKPPAFSRVDAVLIGAWEKPLLGTVCPPFCFVSDNVGAYMLSSLSGSEVNPMTFRQWRKRWGLVRAPFTIFRRVEERGNDIRLRL